MAIDKIEDFFFRAKKIAILGASTNPEKAGHFVPKYLQRLGYKIIPINPGVDELFGERAIPGLENLRTQVDAVIIYRRQAIAEREAFRAIYARIPLIWLPEGIVSEKARMEAWKFDIEFIQDKCPMKEAKRLKIGRPKIELTN